MRGKNLEDCHFVRREPCGTLFSIGELVRTNKNWGETLYKFVNTIWHFDFGPRIGRLAELNQIYLTP